MRKAVLVVGILVLALGVAVDVFLLGPHHVTCHLHVFHLIPGLLVIALAGGSGKDRLAPRRMVGCAAAVVVAGLLVLGFMDMGLMMVIESTTPVIDVAQYEEVLKSYGYPDETILSHFPARVPSEATRVSFYFLYGYLQGNSRFELRCALPASQVRSILDEYTPLAVWVGPDPGPGSSPEGTRLAVIPFRNAENTDYERLPDDFQVLILPTGREDAEQWGYGRGLAVSVDRNEVIWWATWW